MAKGVCKCMTKGVVCECAAKKPRQKRSKKPPRQKASKSANPINQVVLNAVPFHSIPQSFNKESNQGLSEILTNILKQQKQKESSNISTQTISTNNMATEVPDFDSLDLLTPLNQSSVFIPIPKPQEIIYKPKSPKPIAVSNNDINAPSSSNFFASPQFHFKPNFVRSMDQKPLGRFLGFKNNTPSISPPAPPPPLVLFDTAHQTEIVHAEQPPMKGYKPAQPKLIPPPSVGFGSSHQTEIFHAEQPPTKHAEQLPMKEYKPAQPKLIPPPPVLFDTAHQTEVFHAEQPPYLITPKKTTRANIPLQPKPSPDFSFGSAFQQPIQIEPEIFSMTGSPIVLKSNSPNVADFNEATHFRMNSQKVKVKRMPRLSQREEFKLMASEDNEAHRPKRGRPAKNRGFVRSERENL